MDTNTFIDYGDYKNNNITYNNKSLKDNIARWNKGLNYSLSQFYNLDAAKAKMVSSKEDSLYKLNQKILKFEKNFTSAGGQLIIVSSIKDVNEFINEIIKKNPIKRIVVSKSSTLEEIKLNIGKKLDDFSYINIAENIEKICSEKSAHISASAINYCLEEILDIAKQKYEINDLVLTQEGLVDLVSKKIEEKIQKADCLICGANALISDTGSIVEIENEGNILKAFSSTSIQIVVAGIDKIIGQLKDLDVFFPLVASYSTAGFKRATYNTIITPNNKEKTTYLILFNNNRTELLKNGDIKNILRCIKCGACSNVCPVYKNVGGYAYGNAYPGPYGNIVSPFIESSKDYKHLPFTCLLCGRCSKVCPVNINLHELIIKTRNEIIYRDIHSQSDEKLINYIYNSTLRRSRMNGYSHNYKIWRYNRLMKKIWGSNRELPIMSKYSFSKKYTEKLKNINNKQNQNNGV